MFEELVDKILTHNKFGDVKVLAVEGDDFDSVKILVDTGNKQSLFLICTLDKFFSNIPEETLQKINEYRQEKTSEEVHLQQEEKQLLPYNYETTIEQWVDSKKYITSFWFFTNNYPAPVIMDNEIVFISGDAACEYLGLKDSYRFYIYEICNGTKSSNTYAGHKWKFAKEEDIDIIIKNLE